MKHRLIWLLIIFVIFGFPAHALAHVALTSSDPENGSEVQTPVDTIQLTFSGKILPMSTLTIIDETGAEIEAAEISVSETNLIAKLAEPLGNGSYTVNWNVVAEDTHRLEGEIAFNVDGVEAEEPAPEEQAEKPEEPAGGEAEEPEPAGEEAGNPAEEHAEEPEEAPAGETSGGAAAEEPETTADSLLVPIAAGAAILVLAVLLVFLLKPKRK